MNDASAVEAVKAHYTARHTARGDLYGEQPFANYGYWQDPDLTMEQAAEALTVHVGRAARIGRNDRVLDVGCGYGAGAVVFARHFRSRHIMGIDVTEVRIDSGNQYVARHGLADSIELRLGDATAMEFADASFDAVVSVECAFHFDTRRDFLGEAFRVLKPGGRLALTDLIPRRGVDPKSYQQGNRAFLSGVCLDMPVNAYDADRYVEHLQAAGFSDARVESIVDRTRIPFIAALRRYAGDQPAERAEAFVRMADRLQSYVDAGEDYVLVTATRPGA